jgi:flagellar basal-body rod protein FlgB
MRSEGNIFVLINGGIFDKCGIPLYQRLLKVASSAQKTTASNIANVATQGYDAKTVDFKDEMQRSVSSQRHITPAATDSRHLPSNKPEQIVKICEIENDDKSSGINNVDIEREMSDLAENQMMYEFGAKKLARTFGMLRMAIKGRNQ